MSIFNKIFNQGSQLLSTLINKYNAAPPSSQPENININSLVTVFPSCHSETSTKTYSANYSEFVKEQEKDYGIFIQSIRNNVKYNSFIDANTKSKLYSQLNKQSTNGYNIVSIDNFG